MRFLAVFLPRLATDRLTRRRAPEVDLKSHGSGTVEFEKRDGAPALMRGTHKKRLAAFCVKEQDRPFAVFARIKGADRLTGVCARAEALGLAPGMAAADARAMRPSLVLAEADPRADAELLEKIADWSRRFTPLAALDPPHGVLLDISGAAHLFGGEAAMLADIERRLAAMGFCARGAVAPGPALARALARFAPRIVAPPASQQEIETIAAALPVAALGLPDAAPTLARAGLRRIGDLLARPRAPLAARFGREALARLDALTCRSRDPITPRFEAPDFIAERRFPEGLAQTAAIEATLIALAGDLCALLERHGVGARSLEAIFFRVDGAVKRLRARTSRPLRDPLRVAALLREKLGVLAEEGLETGYGLDVFRLCAVEVERLDSAPGAFTDLDNGGASQDERFADLIDRLSARLGPRRVLRLYPRETHIPESAVAALPAAYAPPAGWGEPGGSRFNAAAPGRPLRLFEAPEPIDALALTPDGPPLRFRWRRALHEVVAYEGPERIAPQWWTAEDGAPTRDYFYAQDEDGCCFWLYREGLYGAERAFPCWFVHGLS